MRTIGNWAFLAGVILAVVIGLLTIDKTEAVVLAVLGLLVGLLNVTDKDIAPFLTAGTVIVIVSALGIGIAKELLPVMANILVAVTYIFVPATIIVALKSVFSITHKGRK